MARSVRRILALATVTLLIGIIIAYYNTSSLGYDNANIISFNNEEINIMDYNIKYKDIKKRTEQIKKIIPTETITI